MRERRSNYRVQQGLEIIRVSMAWADQDFVDGRLLDLSARGASVAVAASVTETVPLSVGTPVDLRLEVSGLEHAIDVSAQVRNERGADGQHVVGLEIVEWRELAEKLPPKLLALFNRRRHFRVALPEEPAIGVEISQPDGSSLKARMSDISVSGCGLLLEYGDAPAQGQAVQLRFSLPDSDYHYDMAGVVRKVFAKSPFVQCGVEFEQVESGNMTAQEQRLARYVALRQREPLATKPKLKRAGLDR